MGDDFNFDFEEHPEYAAQAAAPVQSREEDVHSYGRPMNLPAGAGIPLAIPVNKKNFRQVWEAGK